MISVADQLVYVLAAHARRACRPRYPPARTPKSNAINLPAPPNQTQSPTSSSQSSPGTRLLAFQINCKQQHCQHTLYQECGSLYLIPQSTVYTPGA
eukprot:3843284-Rhodomonas_salina.1